MIYVRNARTYFEAPRATIHTATTTYTQRATVNFMTRPSFDEVFRLSMIPRSENIIYKENIYLKILE